MSSRINYDRNSLIQFCRKHHIHRLSFFGSVLREDFGPESDVDVLVEFDPNHIPGFLRLAAMERELSEIIGRKVDMRTPEELSKLFRDDVIASAEVQYAA
jgi:predicted nucleotidyltransferase